MAGKRLQTGVTCKLSREAGEIQSREKSPQTPVSTCSHRVDMTDKRTGHEPTAMKIKQRVYTHRAKSKHVKAGYFWSRQNHQGFLLHETSFFPFLLFRLSTTEYMSHTSKLLNSSMRAQNAIYELISRP